jgi:hypothetical protein
MAEITLGSLTLKLPVAASREQIQSWLAAVRSC